MKKLRFFIFAGVAALSMSAERSKAQFQEWTAEPLPAVQIKTVAFKGWLPSAYRAATRNARPGSGAAG